MRKRDIHSNTSNSYRYLRALAATQEQQEMKDIGTKWSDIYRKAQGAEQKSYRSAQK